MIQDTAWSPRFVASTTATAATSADVNAGTDTNKFITPAALAGSTPTLTLTDAILGTSGPSVKSTLSARAPRQGLVFDGTAGATGNIPALGTGNFTYSVWFNLAATDASNDQPFWGTVNSAAIGVKFNSQRIVVWKPGVGYNAVNSTDIPVGKWVMATYTRSGTTGTYYINGVADGTITDSFDYTAATTDFGSNKVSRGTAISGYLVYNRALSAAEVVALYEAGAPSGADYAPQIAGTALLTGDSSTFTSGVGVWLGLNGGSISASGGVGVISGMASVYDGVQTPNTSPSYLRKGYRYRLTVTTSAYVGGTYIAYGDGAGVTYGVLYAGTSTVEFTAQNSTTFIFFRGGGGCTSVSIDNVTLVPLGLLLAPDAAQAGNGYVWNDQSGNLAQIVLPSSGVQWNLPSVAGQRIRGTTSTNGNQQLLGASVLLPAESQILYVRARARSGTPTITIGTASGGAQIVASVALSTTWLNCTIALTGGIVSSADDIWVGSNSTDVVETDIAFQPLDF